MKSFPAGGIAVVIGATGGIGAALVRRLEQSASFEQVIALSRNGSPPIDLLDEMQVAAAAAYVAGIGSPRLVINAAGVLHDGGLQPEKSWRQIDPVQMQKVFALNTVGPALLLKHFLPLLPREGKSVFAALSARVGSIGDNRLGGWYSYRASKAALNQLLHTAAVELKRRQPQAICVALHPGTVDTQLTKPFAKADLEVQTPDVAAERLLAVIDSLHASNSGGFFDHHGERVPW